MPGPWPAAPSRARRSPAPQPGARNQAHMARPALFVLAARRRYLRRFLSPRNQQNPKRSLEKMKGTEGRGRGGTARLRRAGTGTGQAETREARGLGPGGSRGAGPAGRRPSPGVHFGPPPLEAQLPGVPRPLPVPLPPRPPASLRVLGTRILLQSTFEAPRPAGGQAVSHLERGGWGRGPPGTH